MVVAERVEIAIVRPVVTNNYNHFVEVRLDVDTASKTGELRVWTISPLDSVRLR